MLGLFKLVFQNGTSRGRCYFTDWKRRHLWSVFTGFKALRRQQGYLLQELYPCIKNSNLEYYAILNRIPFFCQKTLFFAWKWTEFECNVSLTLLKFNRMPVFYRQGYGNYLFQTKYSNWCCKVTLLEGTFIPLIESGANCKVCLLDETKFCFSNFFEKSSELKNVHTYFSPIELRFEQN